jgi:Tol biopolymer transport system component
MLRPKVLAIFALFVFSGLASNALAQKRNITEKDLFDFVWIGDFQVSPDGSKTVFVRVTANEKKEGYDTSLWVVPTAGGEQPHQLTGGKRDASPRWSPDGKYLLFVRATEKDGKPEPPQLSILPMAGGDSFSFTDLPKGAGDPTWAPDGKTIAFTSSTNADDLIKQEKKKQKEEELKQAVQAQTSPSPAAKDSKNPPKTSPAGKPEGEAAAKKAETEAEHESDIRVITRAVYRQDDEGYLDPKHPQHIWVITAPHSADDKVKPKQLTTGRFDEGNVVWSKDSSQMFFTTLRVDEPYYDLAKSELYSISPSGGEPTKINAFDMDVNGLSLSPDGKRLAFIAATTQPINSYTQPDLWVVDLAPNSKPKNLTAKFDYDLGAGVFGDSAAPRGGGGNDPVWAPDGRSLIEVYGKEGRTVLGSFDAETGTVTDMTRGNQAVVRFRTSPDVSKIVYALSTATQINDLFSLDRTKADAPPTQLTKINETLCSKI